jgi:hypothetical protein
VRALTPIVAVVNLAAAGPAPEPQSADHADRCDNEMADTVPLRWASCGNAVQQF